MKKQTKVGMNRTGIDMSPVESKKMMEGMKTPSVPQEGDMNQIVEERSIYIREATPLGSVPFPGTLKGVTSIVAKKLVGQNPEVLIDKLSERLAFERTGTRLYDALITKCEAMDAEAFGIPMQTLREFRNEEHRHFMLVRAAMESLGADPTAQTPCADTNGVMAMGIGQVLTDPRTSIPQCMEAILAAELVDNDGWRFLIRLAQEMNLDQMAKDFQTALSEEDNHLENVRRWQGQLVFVESKAA